MPGSATTTRSPDDEVGGAADDPAPAARLADVDQADRIGLFEAGQFLDLSTRPTTSGPLAGTVVHLLDLEPDAHEGVGDLGHGGGIPSGSAT